MMSGTLSQQRWRKLPEAALRLVLILLTHTFYRLRVHGREHVPLEGGALLTPNHVTFIDGLLLIASLVSAMLGDALNASIIAAMVLLGNVLSFAQTYRSQRAVEQLRAGVKPDVSFG